MTEIDYAALETALLSPDLKLINGVGDANIPGIGYACTISEINLVLTGKLSDEPHPCISPVIRSWVIKIQDSMPSSIRNSIEWRTAAIRIAGSANGNEKARVELLLNWMWERLADEAVIRALPIDVVDSWRTMCLDNKTYAAAADGAKAAAYGAKAAYGAYGAYAAAKAAEAAAAYYAKAAAAAYYAKAAYAAAYAAEAAAYAAEAAEADAADAAAYWERANLPTVLTDLINL